jgi:hypothetical protein
MAFVKLFSTITESSLWGETKETRLLFVTMLAKADATGFVEASLPGLARVANLTIGETESALVRLEGPDPHSKSPDHEGRRLMRMEGGWLILNYQVYRERRNDEERQAYMRDYMRRYRSESVSRRKQVLANVSHGKPRLAQAEAEAEAEAENAPSNARAISTDTPFDDSPAPVVPDSARWQYVRDDPWARSIIAAGGKIGANSWPTWKAMVDDHGGTAVLTAIKTVDPTKCFADEVRKALKSPDPTASKYAGRPTRTAQVTP